MTMLRLSLIGLVLAFVCDLVLGQERQPENCPKISVVGYGGVVVLDQVVSFKAALSGLPKEARLMWTLKGGQLVTGQGMPEISVRATRDDLGDNIVATLRVYGLLIGCDDTATESTPVSYTPISEKLLEILSFNKDDYRNEFEDVKRSLIDNPNSQGFVIVNERDGDTEEQLRSRERLVVESLTLGDVKINRSRITMKRRPDQTTESVEIWRVPPGAADPFCEACEPSPKIEAKLECPTLSVSGPAGVSTPGESIEFVASVSPSVPKSVQYKWTVHKGQIIDGQGTLRAKVLPVDLHEGLTATIELIGLPENCPSVASETAVVTKGHVPILIDEFSVPVGKKIDLARLKLAAAEQKRNPNNMLHIVEYFNKNTPELVIRERIRKITEFLTKEMKIDDGFFQIVTQKAARPFTKIYRLPPGSNTPEP